MSACFCIDIGNTRLKYSIFRDGGCKDETVLEATAWQALMEGAARFFEKEGPAARAILCSVVNHPPELEAFLAGFPGFIRLSAQTRLPFSIEYDTPETLGADRLALVAGAVAGFPGENCLVIGMGTCITYNFINSAKQFLGGSISPGLWMRFKAMHQFTGKLPLAEPAPVFPLIGFSTKQSLLSGVMQGTLCEVLGIIELYNNRYANFNVILTGGDASYFAPHLKNKIFADPLFIYKGLNAISEYNAKN